MKYVYPCVVHEKRLALYSVYFPDVEIGLIGGKTLYDALWIAEDLLAGTLASFEDNGKKIPEPVSLGNFKAASDKIVTLIKADTDEYRKKLEVRQ